MSRISIVGGQLAPIPSCGFHLQGFSAMHNLLGPVQVCLKCSCEWLCQMQAHYMARLLTQQGLELCNSDVLQKASGNQMDSSVSMPTHLAVDAPAVGNMHGPLRDQQPAESPCCYRSQGNSDSAEMPICSGRLSRAKQQTADANRHMLLIATSAQCVCCAACT